MFPRLTFFRRTWLQFSLRGMLIAMLVVGVALTIYRWPWEEEKLETPFQTGLLNSDLGFDDGELGLGGAPFGYEPSEELGPWSFHFSWPQGHFPPIPPPWPNRPPDIRIRATYRRGWNGQPLKDGREDFRRPDGTLMAVRHWANGELRQAEWIQPGGEVVRSESYQNGVAHGNFIAHEEARRFSGMYRHGKKTGVWQREYSSHGERITVDEAYDADLPQGAWTWRTASGQILQTAAFDQGQLTTWNGRPWREELQAWLARSEVEPITRGKFQLPIREVTLGEQNVNGNEAFDWFELPEQQWSAISRKADLILYDPPRRDGDGFSFFNLKELDSETTESLLAEILQLALRRSRTLVYRFGVIGVVPICDREVHWRDATGVSQIQFTEDSPQQAAWEETRPSTIPEGFDTDWWFQQLFVGVPIQIDGSDFNPGPDAGTCIRGFTDPNTGESKMIPCDLSEPYLETTHRRSRRDILGLLLMSRGFSCGQRGNVLILSQ